LELVTNTTSEYQPARSALSVRLSEHIWLWGVFWATVVVIYLLPQILDYVLILLLVGLFIKSKKNYFWLAFFILISFPPFGFFTEGSRDAVHRLPLFSLGAGLSFSTHLIFLFVGLAKALLRRNNVYSYFTKHYIVLLIYLGLLAAIAFIVHGTDIGTFMDGIKQVFPLSFIFIIYKLIDTREEKYKFMYLLVPFVFLMLFDALFFLITGGDYIYNYFNPYNQREVLPLGIASAGELNIRFVVMGFHLSYLIFIFSLSFSFLSRYKNYLLLAGLSAFFIILAAALRSWFVIYSIALLFFLFYSSGKIKHILLMGFLFLLLLVPLMQTSTGIQGFAGAFKRISTVFTLGEESSAATQQIDAKITRRLPSQLEYIRENPVTGWAFTEKKGDPDVGNFALLVDAGFAGFLIFLWFWISYIVILRKHILILRDKRARNALRMLIILFLGMLLSHFTTNVVFMLTTGVFIGLVAFVSEFIISEAKNYSSEQELLEAEVNE